MLALVLLGLGALAIRLWGLTRQSLWIDEIFSVKYAGLGEGMTWAKIHVNLQGPLHAVFLYLWTSVFGWSELSIRLPQAIASAATVPLLFLVARKDFGDRTALAGSVALAINPFHVWYAQEVRNYAFVILFAVLSIWAIRRLENRNGFGSIPRIVGTWACGLLSNMSFAFHIVAAGIYAAFRIRGRRPLFNGLVLSAVLTALLLLPWEIGFYERRVQNSYLLKVGAVPEENLLRGSTTAPIIGLPYALYTYAVGYSFGPSLRELHEMPGREALARHAAAIAAATVCFGVLGIAGLVRWIRGDRRRRFWLLCLAIPILLAYYTALRNVKVFNPRYASVGLPAFMMLLADGAAALRPRRLGHAFAAGAIVLSVISVVQLQTRSMYWKEDARSAARILRAEMRPGDLMFVVGSPEPITRYYWLEFRGDNAFKRYTADREVNVDDPAERQKALDAVRSADRSYVVFYRDIFDDPEGKWAALLKSHFSIAQRWDLVGMRIWRLGPEIQP